MIGLVGSADVLEQPHEAAVAALRVHLGIGRNQHQVRIFADFKTAV